MAGITLAQAQQHLSEWLALDSKLASGAQSYILHGRSFTKADAKEIRANIDYWDSKCKELERSDTSGGIRARGGVPA